MNKINNISYRKLCKNEYAEAFELTRKVFDKFEAPVYSKKGINSFYSFLQDDKYIDALKIYGAFDNKKSVGIISARDNGNHIALFFVDEEYQEKGIGKNLFKLVRLDNTSGKITVNSSPYAVNIYHKLGFFDISAETVTDGIRYTPMKYTDTVLETKRLILRPWKNNDAEELFKYAKDPDIGPIAGWPPHTSVENSLDIIRGVLSQTETYAVVLKETGKPVGSVGIMFQGSGSAPINRDESEIGYWIGKTYWGRGLIPEAVNELLRRCFCDLSCNGVWCGYYDGNNKSKRVQEKCGFIYHHTNKNAQCPMGDTRTEHFTYMDKKQWENCLQKDTVC